MPYPGGNVIIDPRDPRKQQFIPDLQKGETTLGDLKHTTWGTVGPGGAGGGGMQYTPAQPAPATVGPRSEGTTPAAPTVAPPATPAVVPVTAQNAPAAPTTAPAAGPNTRGVVICSHLPYARAVRAAAPPPPAGRSFPPFF